MTHSQLKQCGDEKSRRLRLLGEAYFGAHWPSEMAKRLGVARRSVDRWATGERAVTDELLAEVMAIGDERRMEIAAAQKSAKPIAGRSRPTPRNC